jgi:hypothetical protein
MCLLSSALDLRESTMTLEILWTSAACGWVALGYSRVELAKKEYPSVGAQHYPGICNDLTWGDGTIDARGEDLMASNISVSLRCEERKNS